MDRCIKIEHARFYGGLHLAGFVTGVISSKQRVLAYTIESLWAGSAPNLRQGPWGTPYMSEKRRASMGQKIKPLVITVLVLALLPLPFALLLTGGHFLAQGAGGVSKDFSVSYFFGLFTLLAGLGWYRWRHRNE